MSTPMFAARRLVALLAAPLNPSYGTCGRCGLPWNCCRHHSTRYSDSPYGRACFPLCESCWQELGTPAARLPFYRTLWLSWLDDYDYNGHKQKAYAEWCDIERAVMEGR